MVSRTIPAATAASSAPPFDALDEAIGPAPDASLVLLDEVVASLLLPKRQEPTAAMSVTAAVVAGSAWRSYRAGRARIATQAAVYLTWLAPPSSYRCGGVLDLVGSRRAFVWKPSRGRQIFADLLSPGGEGDGEVHVGAKTALEQLADHPGGPVVGVRICTVSAPTRSVLATPTGTMVRLAETSLWFEGDR